MRQDYVECVILSVLGGLQNHFNKAYCVPSQNKILELMKQRHDVSISRRTLNRRLANMSADAIIKRYRRHFRDKTGVLNMCSTAYYLLPRAAKLWKKLAIIGKTLWYKFRVPHMAHNTIHNNSISLSFAAQIEAIPKLSTA